MPSDTDPLADRFRDASIWSLLALAAGTVLAVLVAIVLFSTIAAVTVRYSPLPGPLHQAVVGLPVVFALYAAGRRFVLRAPAAWFLAGRPDRRVLVWAVVGLAFPAAILGIQLRLFGAVTVGDPPATTGVIGAAVTSMAAGLLSGVLEELAFRGVLLRIIEVRWGSTAAIGVTATAFALLHHGHATRPLDVGLVFAAMLAAGVLLGVVVVRTRSVWNAVAVHAGWNTVFGGTLVSVAVGGRLPTAAVLQFQLDGPSRILIGGDGAISTAPLTTFFLLLAAVAVGRFVQPNRRSDGAPTGTATTREAR